jgi:predicted DNA-binding protein YlxM (UPF0122 family)
VFVVEEYIKVAMLLDFYGQLLTERQYQILDLYYNSDYSLSEIASMLNISRQGVYDGVKKGKHTLNEFEGKLGLAKRFSRHEENLKDILSKLRKLKPCRDSEDEQIINECIGELQSVLKEL